MVKYKISYEEHFWKILSRIGLFVAIPYTLGDIISNFFPNEEFVHLGTMIISSILLWILFREIKILDLKGEIKNGKK